MPPTPANDEVPWDEFAPEREPPEEPDEDSLEESRSEGSFEDSRPARWPLILTFIALFLLAAAALLYFWTSRRAAEPPAPPLTPSVAPAPPPPPAADEPPAPPEIELPPLGASDGLIRELVEEISAHPRLAAWLAPDDLVRRFVATVDNLSRGESPRTHLRHLDPGQGFTVDDRRGTVTIDAASFRRYEQAVQVFTSLETARAVELYRQLEPLFEEAYGELGNPYEFEEALDQALDRLLAVQVPEDKIEVERRVDNYRFANPELESLSPAAKHLLRMGPRNAREVQAKLLAFKTALALTRPAEGEL